MYENFKRSEWFRRDRFGMFIHWGLYSIPGRGEWVRGNEFLSDEAYNAYFNEFNPTDYNPREWARLAREAGMKYAVLTTKHHDGFCLFDSAYTDFKSTNTPCGRDLIREYTDAFRAEGLKVGLYYSLVDWDHPAYPAYHHHAHPHREDPAYMERRPFSEYVEYLHNQVRELCENYGKIDLFWFDGSYWDGDMHGEKWEATKLVNMMRSYFPDILINNRLEANSGAENSIRSPHPSVFAGDFTSPEGILPPGDVLNECGESIPWEACITLGDHWSYFSNDNNRKDASIVIRALTECISKNGNLLLDIGPDANGRIPDCDIEILREIGRWVKRYSEVVYGCKKSEFPKPEWGRYVQNGRTVYALITEPPAGPIALTGIEPERIESCRLLSDGTEIKLFEDFRTSLWYGHGSFISIPLYAQYDKICTVIKITLKD